VGAALPLAIVALAPGDRLVPAIVAASLVLLALLGGLAARIGGADVPGFRQEKGVDPNSQTDTYAPWRNAVAKGAIAHRCDNPISYGLMVKAGLGIGLVGNFALADPEFVPVGLGIHVKVPLHIHAQTERLKSRPVRLVFDWLCDVFSPKNPVFAREFNPKTRPQQVISQTLLHISLGSSLPR